MDITQKRSVEEALIDFIIRTAKNDTAPDIAIEVLPDTVSALTKLQQINLDS